MSQGSHENWLKKNHTKSIVPSWAVMSSKRYTVYCKLFKTHRWPLQSPVSPRKNFIYPLLISLRVCMSVRACESGWASASTPAYASDSVMQHPPISLADAKRRSMKLVCVEHAQVSQFNLCAGQSIWDRCGWYCSARHGTEQLHRTTRSVVQRKWLVCRILHASCIDQRVVPIDLRHVWAVLLQMEVAAANCIGWRDVSADTFIWGGV